MAAGSIYAAAARIKRMDYVEKNENYVKRLFIE
jgi:hypothetical protein